MEFHVPNIAQGTIIPNSVYRQIQEDEKHQQQIEELKHLADNAQRQAEASEVIASNASKLAESAKIRANLAIQAAETAKADAKKAQREALFSKIIAILSIIIALCSPFLSAYAEQIMEWLLKML